MSRYTLPGWTDISSGTASGRLHRILEAQQRKPPRKGKPEEEAPFVGVNSVSPLVYKKLLPKTFEANKWKKGQSGNPSGSSAKARLRAEEKRRAKRRLRAAQREQAKVVRALAKAERERLSKLNATDA